MLLNEIFISDNKIENILSPRIQKRNVPSAVEDWLTQTPKFKQNEKRSLYMSIFLKQNILLA